MQKCNYAVEPRSLLSRETQSWLLPLWSWDVQLCCQILMQPRETCNLWTNIQIWTSLSFIVHLHTVTHVDQLFRWPYYKLLELEEKTSFNLYVTVTLPLLRPLSSAKLYTLSCSCLLRRSKYEGYKGSRGHFYDFIELLRPIKMIYIQ